MVRPVVVFLGRVEYLDESPLKLQPLSGSDISHGLGVSRLEVASGPSCKELLRFHKREKDIYIIQGKL